MISKKAEFRIPNFIIGLLLFSAVFALFFLYLSDVSNSYAPYGGVNVIDSSMDAKYNQFDNDTADIKSNFEKISNEDGLFFDTAGIILSSSWSVLKIVFKMPLRMHSMFLNSLVDFGIDSTAGNIILGSLYSAILILIVFSIINYLSRGGTKI